MTLSLALITSLIALATIALAPRASTIGSFYSGQAPGGTAPSLLALTLSQVTTWIFARSILNAAILGYYYGIAGALAYAAYYLSFLTGAKIIDSLRFRHGFSSVQEFLSDRFGWTGSTAYNFVVGVRLLSEVFANLLVIGLIFGAEGTAYYTVSILVVGVVTLTYALIGGLHASIRTDMFQMVLFLAVLVALMAIAANHSGLDLSAIAASSPDTTSPGWVLLVVALLQVWSYPLHDPVMMDRGFIADRKTTLHSFYHAAWLSAACIVAFGMLGVFAGLEKTQGEQLVGTLTRLLGETPMLLFNIALIVSAMSTLDSTFSSAAKLSVVDMKALRPTVLNGRVAMALFLLGGLAMVYLGSKDLFSAVAVSGTASMFLAPVVVISLWLGRTDVPAWSFAVAFLAAMAAAALYFTEAAGYTDLIGPIANVTHKYSKLLVLCAATSGIGFGAFVIGIVLAKKS